MKELVKCILCKEEFEITEPFELDAFWDHATYCRKCGGLIVRRT